MSEVAFRYSPAVAERFPNVRADVTLVGGFVNEALINDLGEAYRTEQVGVVASLRQAGPADRPSIKAWRSVFTGFGVKPTQHRNAAEALFRRLQRHGDIPLINPAVDLGNLISIRHSIPVAVFDVDALTLPVTVSLADGTESFIGIGERESGHPEPGEVIFIDGDGHVVARRWCWKQGSVAATHPGTTNVMFVIEAAHDTAAATTGEAGADLAGLIHRFQPSATTRRDQV